jgi:hypothetical protein
MDEQSQSSMTVNPATGDMEGVNPDSDDEAVYVLYVYIYIYIHIYNITYV